MIGLRIPTEVFFPGGDLSLVEDLYRGDLMAHRFHDLLAQSVLSAVEAIRARRPDSPVRILEVGAGTGSATHAVFEALRGLDRFVEYVYTDVSIGFVQHGKERFGGLAFAKFQMLDIERPIIEQGFDPGAFDLVLASNVLHATRSVRRTLDQVAALAKPAGLLVLNEMTAGRDFATLTFGLLEGWWLSEDPDRRLPHGPLLDQSRWSTALGDAGFDLAQAFGEPGRAGEPFQQCLFLCEKRAPRQPDFPPREYPTVFQETPPAPAPDPVAKVDLLEMIETAVTRVVAEVFEMSAEQVASGKIMSFRDFGADSILSAELVAKINAALELSLQTTAIFNYPGVAELVQHIHDEHGPELAGRLQPAAPAARERQDSREDQRPRIVPQAAAPPPQPQALEDILRQLETGALAYEEAIELYAGEI